jgi:RNA polymerase sigma factor (sigma-70 family)
MHSPPPPPDNASDLARSFEALIRPHIMPLYSAAYRLLGNRDDAEDLVQDVLIKVYPRVQEMLQLRDSRQWLLRVLYNQFVDFTRQRSRRPRVVHDEGMLDTAPDTAAGPEQLAAQAAATAKIDAALADLSPAHRALVTLHMLDGYSLEELTTVFDVPLGTLKSRLHRAKAALKASLGLGPHRWNLFR